MTIKTLDIQNFIETAGKRLKPINKKAFFKVLKDDSLSKISFSGLILEDCHKLAKHRKHEIAEVCFKIASNRQKKLYGSQKKDINEVMFMLIEAGATPKAFFLKVALYCGDLERTRLALMAGLTLNFRHYKGLSLEKKHLYLAANCDVYEPKPDQDLQAQLNKILSETLPWKVIQLITVFTSLSREYPQLPQLSDTGVDETKWKDLYFAYNKKGNQKNKKINLPDAAPKKRIMTF